MNVTMEKTMRKMSKKRASGKCEPTQVHERKEPRQVACP